MLARNFPFFIKTIMSRLRILRPQMFKRQESGSKNRFANLSVEGAFWPLKQKVSNVSI